MTTRNEGKGNSPRQTGEGIVASAIADVCNDAGGALWCPRCLAAHGAWNASCPRYGRVLVALPRLSRIKREAA